MYVLNGWSDSGLQDMLSPSHAPCAGLLEWAPTSEVAVPASGAPAQHCVAWVHGLAQPNQRSQHALVRARRRYRSRSLQLGCSQRLDSKQAKGRISGHRHGHSCGIQQQFELLVYVQSFSISDVIRRAGRTGTRMGEHVHWQQ